MFEFRGERGVHVYAEAHQHHPVGPLHPGVDLSDEGGSNHRQPSYISRQVINDLIWSLDIQIFLLTIWAESQKEILLCRMGRGWSTRSQCWCLGRGLPGRLVFSLWSSIGLLEDPCFVLFVCSSIKEYTSNHQLVWAMKNENPKSQT